MHPGRKCIYDANAVKYLVQVRDDVEAGDEKLRGARTGNERLGHIRYRLCLGRCVGR